MKEPVDVVDGIVQGLVREGLLEGLKYLVAVQLGLVPESLLDGFIDTISNDVTLSSVLDNRP